MYVSLVDPVYPYCDTISTIVKHHRRPRAMARSGQNAWSSYAHNGSKTELRGSSRVTRFRVPKYLRLVPRFRTDTSIHDTAAPAIPNCRSKIIVPRIS